MTKSNSQLSESSFNNLRLTAELMLAYSSTSSLFFTTSFLSCLSLIRKFYTQPYTVRRWDSVVGIAAVLLAGTRGIEVRLLPWITV